MHPSFLCRVEPKMHKQSACIDFCIRAGSNKSAQVFRLRSDNNMLAYGENGFFQTEKDGPAEPYGPVMVHNFLLDFSPREVFEELKTFFRSNYQVSDAEFDEIFKELDALHGDVNQHFKHIDRLVMYTSMRYIIRDFCQIRQRSLRKKLTVQASLKQVSVFHFLMNFQHVRIQQ